MDEANESQLKLKWMERTKHLERVGVWSGTVQLCHKSASLKIKQRLSTDSVWTGHCNPPEGRIYCRAVGLYISFIEVYLINGHVSARTTHAVSMFAGFIADNVHQWQDWSNLTWLCSAPATAQKQVTDVQFWGLKADVLVCAAVAGSGDLQRNCLDPVETELFALFHEASKWCWCQPEGLLNTIPPPSPNAPPPEDQHMALT